MPRLQSRKHHQGGGLSGEKSSLFYEYLRLLDETKPAFFLLENTLMPADDMAKISSYLGCEPIRINSSLVSGQLRDRLYWTNIGGYERDLFGWPRPALPSPSDKKITLQSVLTSGYTDREKSRALLESDSRPLRDQARMLRRYKNGFTTIVFESDHVRYLNQAELERLQTVPEGYTSILTRNQAASVLGDGWTVDVIAHIFKHIL